MNSSAIQVIDALGGTSAVAKMFEIAMPSVTAWKGKGIPRARMMFLRVAHKRTLAGIDLQAATAKPKPVTHNNPSTHEVNHG